jgi:hypothetical protein
MTKIIIGAAVTGAAVALLSRKKDDFEGEE